MRQLTHRHITLSLSIVICVTVILSLFIIPATAFPAIRPCQVSASTVDCSAKLTESSNRGTLTPPVIGKSQAICFNSTPAPLTILSRETGGTGGISYQWQQSLDNGTSWTNVFSADSTVFSAKALTASTQFVLLVIDSDIPPNVVSSNVVEIKVNPEPCPVASGLTASPRSPTAMTASASVTTAIKCNGLTATVTMTAAGGSAPYTYTFNGTSQAGTVFTGIAAGLNIPWSVRDNLGVTVAGSLTVTQPDPIVVNATSNSPVCEGQDITVTATVTGGTGSYSYAWTGPMFFTAITRDFTYLGVHVYNSGLYTLTVTDANGCTGSVTINIVVNPIPTVNVDYWGQPFCTSQATAQNISFSGGSGAYTGGTFSSTAGLTINPSTGAIIPSTSTAGTYTVTYLIPASGGCAAVPVTTTVTIDPLPTAVISYVGAPFCISVATAQPVTLTGTGGVFSATPGGLSINASTGAILPSASAANTYTVKYTIAASGNCSAVVVSTSVKITTVPTATISWGTPFCRSVSTPQAVTLTGTGAFNGGTYSAAAGLTINPATGGITPSTSTAGTYVVTYTVPATGGCAAVPVTINVTINDLPTMTMGSSPAVCQGVVLANLPYTATSASPDKYSITWDATALGAGFINVGTTPLPASPFALTVPAAAAAGTYNGTLTLTNSTTGCISTGIPFTVTLNPLPVTSAIYH